MRHTNHWIATAAAQPRNDDITVGWYLESFTYVLDPGFRRDDTMQTNIYFGFRRDDTMQTDVYFSFRRDDRMKADI